MVSVLSVEAGHEIAGNFSTWLVVTTYTDSRGASFNCTETVLLVDCTTGTKKRSPVTVFHNCTCFAGGGKRKNVFLCTVFMII